MFPRGDNHSTSDAELCFSPLLRSVPGLAGEIQRLLTTLRGKNFILRSRLSLPSVSLKQFPLSCPYRPF